MVVGALITGVAILAGETPCGALFACFGLQSLVGAVVAILACDTVGPIFTVDTIRGTEAAGGFVEEETRHALITLRGIMAFFAIEFAFRAIMGSWIEVVPV